MLRKSYYITVLITMLGGSFQFYSYDVVNPAQRTLIRWLNQTYSARGTPKNETQLNLLWSVIVSCIAVGAICGALSTKKLAEHFGRRNALIANGTFNVFGALLEFLSKPLESPEMLITGRVILGANMGLVSGLVPIFLMEITPTRHRGTVGTCHMVPNRSPTISVLLRTMVTQYLRVTAELIAVAFSDWFSLFTGLPEVLGGDRSWSFAFGFPGLTALFMCCILPFCPESPKYSLLSRRDRVRTLDDIARLVSVQEGHTMYEDLQREAQRNADETQQASVRYLITCKQLRVPLVICIWIMVAQQFTGAAAVFAYSTDMFLNAGLEPQIARFSTLGIGIMYFMFACSSAFLIERKGRRILSLFQLSTVTAALIAMSLFTWAQNNFNSRLASYLSIIALLIYMCGYGIGSPIPWMIASEIFPTKFRSSAVTVAISIAWTLTFIISLAYLPFKQCVGVSLSYLPFILVSAMSTCFVYFLLPETKNRQSNEIAEDIQIRSDNLRRYSLNIIPSVSSAIGILPSNEASEQGNGSHRARLIPRSHTSSGTLAQSQGKYSSLGFTPHGEHSESFFTRMIYGNGNGNGRRGYY